MGYLEMEFSSGLQYPKFVTNCMKFRFKGSDIATVNGKNDAVEYDEINSNGKIHKQSAFLSGLH